MQDQSAQTEAVDPGLETLSLYEDSTVQIKNYMRHISSNSAELFISQPRGTVETEALDSIRM